MESVSDIELAMILLLCDPIIYPGTTLETEFNLSPNKEFIKLTFSYLVEGFSLIYLLHLAGARKLPPHCFEIS